MSVPFLLPGAPPIRCQDLFPGQNATGIEASPLNPFIVDVVWGSGVAGVNRGIRLAEVGDGLSKTAAVAEVRAGVNDDDRRGTWAMPSIGASILFGHGRFGMCGRPNSLWPMADRVQDCQATATETRDGMGCVAGPNSDLAASKSLHPAGVNVLLMDGSARFIEQAVSVPVWHALNTRNGGDDQ